MPPIPPAFCTVISQFAPQFARRVWPQAQLLLVGAILAPGRRTIAAVLRILGLADRRGFHRYHRVLNRAAWSGRVASRVLLLAAFAPTGPVVLGLDETLERRWGRKIAARGIYRDSARSSREVCNRSSGLRWVFVMLLVPIPWAGRTWALPFLTALAPSERYHAERGIRHKTLPDWGRQLPLQARRWLPDRPLVAVADRGYAALRLLDRCRRCRRPVVEGSLGLPVDDD